MLALLLRGLLLLQLTLGALLGSLLAVRSAQHGAGPAALLWVPLLALALPLLTQAAVISSSMFNSRATGLPPRPWRAWWAEYRASVLVFMLRQPWPRHANRVLPALADTQARLPVLLVHGYVCNHRVWDAMAQALRQAGHPVLALDLEPVFGSIDSYASVIESALGRLLAQTGATRVALVGHSMGGLAIRAWLRTQDSPALQRVARIITLGTPHQGTQLPQPYVTTNGGQMRWHSDWLATLALSEDPFKRSLMSIALNLQDNIVYPQRAQLLPGTVVTEFRGIGHLEMCLNPAVIAWVCQQLGQVSTAKGQA
jgi:pimeloyl-ACP methyl ester carboxylesterase